MNRPWLGPDYRETLAHVNYPIYNGCLHYFVLGCSRVSLQFTSHHNSGMQCTSCTALHLFRAHLLVSLFFASLDICFMLLCADCYFYNPKKASVGCVNVYHKTMKKEKAICLVTFIDSHWILPF